MLSVVNLGNFSKCWRSVKICQLAKKARFVVPRKWCKPFRFARACTHTYSLVLPLCYWRTHCDLVSRSLSLTHIQIQTYIHTHSIAYTYPHTHTHTHTHTLSFSVAFSLLLKYTHTYTRTHTHSHAHTHTRTHTHTHAHTHAHTHTTTHTHTHPHTQTGGVHFGLQHGEITFARKARYVCYVLSL